MNDSCVLVNARRVFARVIAMRATVPRYVHAAGEPVMFPHVLLRLVKLVATWTGKESALELITTTA